MGERTIPHLKDIFSLGNPSDKKLSDNHDNKTYNNHDHNTSIKHIERHLSMKKTIRKKIMRELREVCWVEEETNNQTNSNAATNTSKNNQTSQQQQGLLETLRNGGDLPDFENREKEKTSFWRRITGRKNKKH